MKTILIAGALIVLVGIGVFFYTRNGNDVDMADSGDAEQQENQETTDESQNEEEEQDDSKTVIGESIEGRDITAYHFGTGEKHLLFIGGIHGGYGWNTALVAYELIDYLDERPEAVPENLRITVIPVLNPDGLYKVVGVDSRFDEGSAPKEESEIVAGRFNANNVDLNRNFECDWQEDAMWKNTKVSGGERAFSEPESFALKSFVDANKPDAVVAWYSAAGGVFASNCHGGVLPQTSEMTEVFANASGYRAYKEFNFYEITGDMVNWFAKNNTPAISVLLTNHTDVEWSKNREGIEALIAFVAGE